jgi:hypothetical protein
MQYGSDKNTQPGATSRQGRRGLAGPVRLVMVAIVAAGFGWIAGRLQTAPVASVAKPEWRAEPTAPAPRHATTRIPAPNLEHRVGAAVLPAADAGGGTSLDGLDSELLVARLASGTDAERLAALNTALEYDVELPAERLIDAYEHDASDDVRLLAFTTYIDTLATQVEVARAAMHSATGNASRAVRAEAGRRLDELTAYEAQLTLAPAGPDFKH